MSGSDDEFFVGYLPTPPRTRARNRAVAALAVLLPAAIAAGAAASMVSPGDGLFSEGARFTGVLRVRPYGMLDVEDTQAPGGVATILLVRQAKFGLGHAYDALDGQVVTVRGGLMAREGGRMLELGGAPTPAPAALAPALVARLRAVRDERLDDTTLDGEIVDSKCWLGRMKPGGGRTHRACAQLCVSGGIPPVLVTRDVAGREHHYLLETRDGGAIHMRILGLVAEPVRVRGTLYRRADRMVLRTDASDVERR